MQRLLFIPHTYTYNYTYTELPPRAHKLYTSQPPKYNHGVTSRLETHSSMRACRLKVGVPRRGVWHSCTSFRCATTGRCSCCCCWVGTSCAARLVPFPTHALSQSCLMPLLRQGSSPSDLLRLGKDQPGGSGAGNEQGEASGESGTNPRNVRHHQSQMIHIQNIYCMYHNAVIYSSTQEYSDGYITHTCTYMLHTSPGCNACGGSRVRTHRGANHISCHGHQRLCIRYYNGRQVCLCLCYSCEKSVEVISATYICNWVRLINA